MEKVEIIEPSQDIRELQERLMTEIKSLLPASHAELVGASAVPMVGRREIDIMVLSEKVESDSAVLESHGFSRGPTENAISYLRKHVDDVEIGVQVTTEDNQMVSVHRGMISLLQEDEVLRKQYEDFKRTLSGRPSGEYKKRKSDWIKEHILPYLK